MAAKNPGQHRSALRHLELHAFAVRDLVRELIDIYTRGIDI